jgi:chemotaxis signal transduction protein
VPAPTPDTPPAPEGELRYGFRLGGLLLVPASRVPTELVADAQVFPVPHGPSGLAGVINLHGTIVPLFDPALAGRPRPDIRPTRRLALVFDRDEQRAGLLVDAAPQPVRLWPATQAPKPAGPLSASLRRAWLQLAGPGAARTLWWEFDHRAAFALLGAEPPQHNPDPYIQVTA